MPVKETIKQIIATVFLLCGLCSTSFAQLIDEIVAPQDAGQVRHSMSNRPELKKLQDAYGEIINIRLSPLKHDEVEKIFGPKLIQTTNWMGHDPNKYPADLVLPIFGHGNYGDGSTTLILSGAIIKDDKTHNDLHAIGDIGYVEFYYGHDGENLQTAVIYFRADDKFIPLKSTSTNDFSKRLNWDKAKFDALNKWLDDHMPKLNDLGVVKVSLAHPSRIELGGGAALILTQPPSSPPATPTSIHVLDIGKEISGSKDSNNILHVDFDYFPGQSIGFAIDGRFYRITPKPAE